MAGFQGQNAGCDIPLRHLSGGAPGTRNAVALITIFDKDKPEFKDPTFLKKILQGDCLRYVNGPADLAKLEFKEARLAGGLGFYANFTDPDLVGRPVKRGAYKTATPMMLCLGEKYLVKVSLLCDDLAGVDYRELRKLVETLQIKLPWLEQGFRSAHDICVSRSPSIPATR